MERRCSGQGLMLAGIVVAAIGLALVAGESLQLPHHWQTAAVGAVLFAFGALRWATRRADDSAHHGER